MPYSFSSPPYSSTSMGNENIPNVGTIEFPVFSTQNIPGGISGVNEVTPNAEDATPTRRKSLKWTISQNLVLLRGWIKYGTDSLVGINQKNESYWRQTAEYYNEHCSFDPPRDGALCRNHYNNLKKILGKWIGAYDNSKRMQQSGWSENDVLAKVDELYSSGKNSRFNLLSEWFAVRDQPRYGSQVGRNSGLKNSGSKRVHKSDASDFNVCLIFLCFNNICLFFRFNHVFVSSTLIRVSMQSVTVGANQGVMSLYDFYALLMCFVFSALIMYFVFFYFNKCLDAIRDHWCKSRGNVSLCKSKGNVSL